jgi:peptidoglycan/xylan/chitin deacetylase (PgdA/CDA1 family)
MNEINIIMYHYIRPATDNKYPGIKVLEFNAFKRQLDYLQESFTIISVDQILANINNKSALPKNACWLTFDDGYKDHYNYVLPELKKRKLQGSFFPPRNAVKNSEVLDVNSIHHILSKCKNISKLRVSLDRLCLETSIKSSELKHFWNKYGVPNRWDNETTIYIKRMLQHVLPEENRNFITQKLFQEYVGVSQKELSNELYMSVSEVRKLVKEGMHVGSHGSRHYWLDRITKENQRIDIQDSLEFLEDVGASTKNWVMCYPYGAYNSDTLSLVNSLGAKVGITCEVRKANLDTDNQLILPRFDTNDFPQ